MEYLIGQRVILNNKELGRVVAPPVGRETVFGIWVYSYAKEYASDYDLKNVKPLPNGQL